MEKDLDLYAAFYQVKKEMAKLAKDDEIAYGDAYKKLEDSFNRCRPVVAEEIYALCNRVNSVLEMLPDTMREKCKINTKNKPSIFLTGEFSGGKTTLIHQLAGHKRRLYTWTSPDGQHQNQIDYILCSQRWKL